MHRPHLKTRNDQGPAGDSSAFFGRAQLDQDPIHAGSFHRFSRILENLEERALDKDVAPPKVIYRLLVIPLNGTRMVVRVNIDGPQASIVAKLWREKDGALPGKMEQRLTRPLDAQEKLSLAGLANDLQFLSLSTFDSNSGMDGIFWILEGSMGGQYHVVVRWEPQPGAFDSYCRYLLRIAGFKDNNYLLWGRPPPGRKTKGDTQD